MQKNFLNQESFLDNGVVSTSVVLSVSLFLFEQKPTLYCQQPEQKVNGFGDPEEQRGKRLQHCHQG